MSEMGRRTVAVETYDDCSVVRIAPPIGLLAPTLLADPRTNRLPALFVPVPNDEVPVESVYRLCDSEFKERPRSAGGDFARARGDVARSVAARIITVLSESGVQVAERMQL